MRAPAARLFPSLIALVQFVLSAPSARGSFGVCTNACISAACQRRYPVSPLCIPAVYPRCVSPLCVSAVCLRCVSPLCIPAVYPRCVSAEYLRHASGTLNGDLMTVAQGDVRAPPAAGLWGGGSSGVFNGFPFSAKKILAEQAA